MNENRISDHPIVHSSERRRISFFFEDRECTAFEGEMISSALFANGIRIFGRHHKDGSPQGIFCANGQCAQCLVLADGQAVKSCITEIAPDMKIRPMEGLPALPEDDSEIPMPLPEEIETEVLIMGGGPAGLSAAIELGAKGVRTILADDKHELGGKLGLQTHNFFGSVRDCFAGTRGMDIGTMLARQAGELETVQIWLNSPVVGVFADRKIGILKDGRYVLVKPNVFLSAAGAREKTLPFPGSDLPGIYGAGAFQTLVNRDLVKTSKRLFIVGGGNVGLIAAYHAMQAGIEVVGLVEALPACGGYKVHLDKIRRLGIPVWTSHTILRAEGDGRLEKVVTTAIDGNFRPIKGTEAEFDVDTLLVAVGLTPINEMAVQAREFGIKTYFAGDSEMIAEASAAIFSGKITGRKILQDMGRDVSIPEEWSRMVRILRGQHGSEQALKEPGHPDSEIYPVVRCVQQIPCNPCSETCIIKSIGANPDDIMKNPEFHGKCLGCGRCVSTCPGLAITLVDQTYDPKRKFALVTIPWEMPEGRIQIGDKVSLAGFEGETVCAGKIVAVRNSEWQDRRKLVQVEVPFDNAAKVAGIRIVKPVREKKPRRAKASGEDIIICRCQRVTKSQIREKIMQGCLDMNALKAELQVGMGPCGGKTCMESIARIYRECGIAPDKIVQHIHRPFDMEVPLSAFGKQGK